MLTNSKTLAFTFAVITNLQINVVAGYFFLCSAEQSAFHTFLLVISYLRYSRNSDHYKQTYGCVFVLFCFFYQNLISICILLHTSSVSQICKKKMDFQYFAWLNIYVADFLITCITWWTPSFSPLTVQQPGLKWSSSTYTPRTSVNCFKWFTSSWMRPASSSCLKICVVHSAWYRLLRFAVALSTFFLHSPTIMKV